MTPQNSAYEIATRIQNHEDWYHSPRDNEPDLGELEEDPQLERYNDHTEFEHEDTGAVLMLSSNTTFRGEGEQLATAELCQPLDSELDLQYSDDFESGFFADLFDAYRSLESQNSTEYTGTREPDSAVVMAASFPNQYDLHVVDQTADSFSEVSQEVQSLHGNLRSAVRSLSEGGDYESF